MAYVIAWMLSWPAVLTQVPRDEREGLEVSAERCPGSTKEEDAHRDVHDMLPIVDGLLRPVIANHLRLMDERHCH